MNETEKAQRLERAAEHIFSTAQHDAAADLCLRNMTYGMAKIHLAQEAHGLAPEAVFIGTPDMTITRNSGRWRAGIGYGGKLSWGDGSRDLLILDGKPNTCGMLVGGLTERPDALALTRRLHALHREQVVIDDIKITWDFGTGNHFIDVFSVEQHDGADLPPYVFVMHASGAELRSENEYGPGLYWDDSSEWQRRCELLETPWGPLHILTGGDLRDYLEVYRRTDDFAIRRRHFAAEALFGQFHVLSNTNHQGLANANEMLLGCQSTVSEDEHLLPIMVRADRPAFLMKGLPNLSDEQIERLGFHERAQRWGVLDQLRQANVIPHGAGYSLPHLSRVQRVMEIDGTRYYELERTNQADTQIISEPKDLTCGYRDEAVVTRTVECALGTIAARLDPLFVLKS